MFNSLTRLISKNDVKKDRSHRKVYKQGELTKQGGGNGGWKTWKVRWFVFHDKGISYYTSEKAYHNGESELGFLVFNDKFDIKSQDDITDNFFRIASTHRTLVVQAKSLSIKQEWIDLLPKIKHELAERQIATDLPESSMKIKKIKSKEKVGFVMNNLNNLPQTKSDSLKEGYLELMNSGRKRWNTYYFVLFHDSLNYYNKPLDKNPVNTIKLTGDMAGASTLDALKGAFVLIPQKGKKYMLKGVDNNDRISWLISLQKILPDRVMLPNDYAPVIHNPTSSSNTILLKNDSKQLSDLLWLTRRATARQRARHNHFRDYCLTVIMQEEIVLFYISMQEWSKFHNENAETGIRKLEFARNIYETYLKQDCIRDIGVPPDILCDLSEHMNRTLEFIEQKKEEFRKKFDTEIYSKFKSEKDEADENERVKEEEYYRLAEKEKKELQEQLQYAEDVMIQIYNKEEKEYELEEVEELETLIALKREKLRGIGPPEYNVGKSYDTYIDENNTYYFKTRNTWKIIDPDEDYFSKILLDRESKLSDARMIRKELHEKKMAQNDRHRGYIIFELIRRLANERASRESLYQDEWNKRIKEIETLRKEEEIKYLSTEEISLKIEELLPPYIFERSKHFAFDHIRYDIYPRYIEQYSGDKAKETDKCFYLMDNVSLDELMEALTNPRIGGEDADFRRAFLLFHIQFMKSNELLNRLSEHVFTPPLDEKSTTEPMVIQCSNKMYIFKVLQEWMRLHPQDIQFEDAKKFRRECKDFRNHTKSMYKRMKAHANDNKNNKQNNSLLNDSMNTLYDLINITTETFKIVEKLFQSKSSAVINDDDIEPLMNIGTPLLTIHTPTPLLTMHTPTPLLPSLENIKIHDSNDIFGSFNPHYNSINSNDTDVEYVIYDSLSQLTGELIATSLTSSDYVEFRKIDLREFVGKVWTKKGRKEKEAPNILKMIELFNIRTYWVAAVILRCEEQQARLNMMKLFIDVAQCARKFNNFFLLFSVISGLGVQPLHRLKNDWSALSSNKLAMYNKLKDITLITPNYKNYRTVYQASIGKAQIPNLAVTTKDCFQLEERDTFDELTNNINFNKFYKQYEVLEKFQQCQKIVVNFKDNENINILLRESIAENIVSEDDLWALSYIIQARRAQN